MKGYSIGDRVAGFVHGAKGDNGSFAEYCTTRPGSTFRIPEAMSFEQAATFGIASSTSGIALFQRLGLPTPEKPYTGPVAGAPKLLIW